MRQSRSGSARRPCCFFALFYLVPSWRGAIRDIVAGLGFTLIAAGLPYSLSQPARTRRQRAALMFFGLGGVVFFIMAIGALLPSRFADHGVGFWILEALILPTGIAMFILPFLFLHFANRLDVRRYSHIVEYHSLLARLVWESELGPKPLGGIYHRALLALALYISLIGSVAPKALDDLSRPMRIG